MTLQADLQQQYKRERDYAMRLERENTPVLDVLRHLSNATDAMIGSIVTDFQQNYGRKYATADDPFAICAVGGYGRQQLHPHSDIDLLFIYPWKPTPIIESTAEHVLYTLWDMGLKVGHATRSIDDCIQYGEQDATIRTNLLDIRFIVGDQVFFADALEQLQTRLLRQRIAWFGRQKLAELQDRRSRYGQSAYVLEPNIKESPGGIRDIHTAYWIAKSAFRCETFAPLYTLGILEQQDARTLDQNYSELLRLRNRLHFCIDKPGDQLSLSVQPLVAEMYGLKDSDTELATEALMRRFYELARDTRQTVDIALEVFMDRLDPPARTLWFRRKRALGDGFYRYRNQIYGATNTIEDNPQLILEAFRLSQQEKAPLSWELKKTVSRHADKLKNLDKEKNDIAASALRAILTTPDNMFSLLQEMNELGPLRAYLPEFEHQYCRVQHDTYHIYTADTHLLVCMRVFAELLAGQWREREPEIQEIADRMPDPIVVALSVLLHDIGKGYGRDHSVVGAEIAEPLGRKLGLKPGQARTVAFLVREHLTLSHTAQRRDLSDHRVIRDFARKMPDAETLDALLLLTFCDQNGVGPNVWTPWKRSLMLQLHDDAQRQINREDIQGVYRDRIRRRKNQIRRGLGDCVPKALLEQFIEAMPPRFFLRNDDNTLQEVVNAYAGSTEKEPTIAIVPQPEIEGARVILSQPDRPGVFAFHAGLFALSDMSIVNAEGYSLPDLDWATNIFSVKSLDPIFFEQPERIERFKENLVHWMHNPEQTTSAIKQKLDETAPPTPASRRRIRVRIDRTLSQNYTVFEVFCWDRIGLLYELSTVFRQAGYNIWLAKIDTEGKRVSDIFYVQMRNEDATEDEKLLQSVQKALYDVIS